MPVWRLSVDTRANNFKLSKNESNKSTTKRRLKMNNIPRL